MADVLSEVRGAALHITINRPDHGNSIADPMAQQLTELFTDVGKPAKFVVLPGSDADFCFGRAPGPLPAGQATWRAMINSSSEVRKPGSSHGTGHGEQI